MNVSPETWEDTVDVFRNVQAIQGDLSETVAARTPLISCFSCRVETQLPKGFRIPETDLQLLNYGFSFPMEDDIEQPRFGDTVCWDGDDYVIQSLRPDKKAQAWVGVIQQVQK